MIYFADAPGRLHAFAVLALTGVLVAVAATAAPFFLAPQDALAGATPVARLV